MIWAAHWERTRPTTVLPRSENLWGHGRCLNCECFPTNHYHAPKGQHSTICLISPAITVDFERWLYSKLDRVIFCDENCCSLYIEITTRLGPLEWTPAVQFRITHVMAALGSRLSVERMLRLLKGRVQELRVTGAEERDDPAWSTASWDCRGESGNVWIVTLRRIK